MTTKRKAEIEGDARPVIRDLSKAAIIEAYRDLYLQVFGEDQEDLYHDADPIAWAHDLTTRADHLAFLRKQYKAQDAAPYYDDKGQWENHQIEMMGPPIKRDEDIYGWPDGFRGE